MAIEYLTKWIEAKALTTNDIKTVSNFLFEQIITRFGCLETLISNKGSHFLKEVMKGITKQFIINY